MAKKKYKLQRDPNAEKLKIKCPKCGGDIFSDNHTGYDLTGGKHFTCYECGNWFVEFEEFDINVTRDLVTTKDKPKEIKKGKKK